MNSEAIEHVKNLIEKYEKLESELKQIEPEIMRLCKLILPTDAPVIFFAKIMLDAYEKQNKSEVRSE